MKGMILRRPSELWRLGVLTFALSVLQSGSAGAVQAKKETAKMQSGSPATAEAVVPPATPPFMASGRTPNLDRAPDPERPRISAAFVIEPHARAALRALWAESIRVGEERAGCVAGHVRDGVFRLTRAQFVETEKADSLQISPGPSLNRCGPPEWSGTVHTHIATFNGHPFATLSPSDRAVMNTWRQKWEQEGLFCVLYSATEAYCEYGTTLTADTEYAAHPDR